MDIEKKLNLLGLTKSEAKVYLFLLENGISTPPQIAKGTKIARTNCYNILKQLLVGGFIDEQQKNKKKIYIAEDPQAVVRALEKKREAAEHLLPELRALYKVQKNQPVIKFHDGLENILSIFDATLESKEIMGIASTEKLFSLAGSYFTDYQKKIRTKGIKFQDILTHASGREAGKKARLEAGPLYEYRLLPEKFENIPADILVWDNNVALINLDEPVFGTVISNKSLASSFRVMLKIIWECAQKT